MDDAFAKGLFGDACETPADALRALRPLLPLPLRCSRERPFGIHADLGGGRCPRCGWTPKRRNRLKG
ncbi:MAG TPA: hypothetical protein VF603_16670 [Allosphingosinicella sp.]